MTGRRALLRNPRTPLHPTEIVRDLSMDAIPELEDNPMGRIPAISILDAHLEEQALTMFTPAPRSTSHLSISIHPQRSSSRDC